MRIHPDLKPHPIYAIIKDNIKDRKQLMNTVKLLSFPETSDADECAHCTQIYTDTVSHYVLSCQGLVQERTELWDNILNCLSCEAEAILISQDTDIQLDTLLSRQWALFNDGHEYYKFSCVVAKELTNLMYVV